MGLKGPEGNQGPVGNAGVQGPRGPQGFPGDASDVKLSDIKMEGYTGQLFSDCTTLLDFVNKVEAILTGLIQ